MFMLLTFQVPIVCSFLKHRLHSPFLFGSEYESDYERPVGFGSSSSLLTIRDCNCTSSPVDLTTLSNLEAPFDSIDDLCI